MNLDDNIRNAFKVVLKTYESVDKLMTYCDFISSDFNYNSAFNKFLRFKSDPDYNGWFIDSFYKLYQYKEDELLETEWRNGPIYVIEISFVDLPKLKLGKFEYEDINKLASELSASNNWLMRNPMDKSHSGFTNSGLENKDGYFTSKAKKADIKKKHKGLKKVIYTEIKLTDIDRENAGEKIFGEFEKLRKMD